MNHLKPIFLIATTLLISSCATMNSDFSCKATATDSCLTIEQVDAMTRFADDAPQKRMEIYIPARHDAHGNLIPAHTLRSPS